MSDNINFSPSSSSAISVGSSAISASSSFREEAALKAWWEKYNKIEREIHSARERRRSNAQKKRHERVRLFGDICEMTDGAAVRWRSDGFDPGEEFLLTLFRDTGYYAFLDYMRRESSRTAVRLKAAVRRPSYYEAENARRRALAAERRRIRKRRTESPCPSAEQILDAWIVRRRSHEDAIRFGSLIEDLECYVDNSLCRDEDGVIIGRRAGVKGWLKEYVPALALQYTTVMRYKAAAKKLKEIAGLKDPTPAAAAIPPAAVATAPSSEGISPAGRKQDYGADEISVRAGEESEIAVEAVAGSVEMVAERVEASAGTETDSVKAGADSVEIVRAWAIWQEVVKGARGSATALFERIDALTDPRRIEDANMLKIWREKYANRITVRTKRMWLKRLWRRAAGRDGGKSYTGA